MLQDGFSPGYASNSRHGFPVLGTLEDNKLNVAVAEEFESYLLKCIVAPNCSEIAFGIPKQGGLALRVESPEHREEVVA